MREGASTWTSRRAPCANAWWPTGLRIVPVDDETAIRSVELGAEGFHADPADRIIAATAVIRGYRLATADREITAWASRSRIVATLDPTV